MVNCGSGAYAYVVGAHRLFCRNALEGGNKISLWKNKMAVANDKIFVDAYNLLEIFFLYCEQCS